MGLLGGIKKVAKKVGNVAYKASPLLGLIPGVGTLAAAGIGAGGALLSGRGLGGAAKGAGMGAAGDIGQHFAQKIPGVGKYFDTDKLLSGGYGGGGAAPNAPSGAQAGPEYLEGPGGLKYRNPATMTRVTDPGGGGGGGLGGAAKFLFGDKLASGGLLPLALGLAGTVQNAQQNTKQNHLTDEQIANARAAIARQRELQDRALQPINVQAPDYTSIFAQTQNPFYQGAR